jgi:hypothetical protein
MKRKWLAALCLVMIAALLSACDGQQPSNQTFTEVTQYLGPTSTASPVPSAVPADGNSVFSNNPYVANTDQGFSEADALGEEDGQDNGVYDDGAIANGQADTTVYPYAGSSPIPLEPVDAPSPTPRQALSFTYVQYDIPALGLSFEGPAGWVPDTTVSEMYTLTEPEQQIKDGQLGILKLYASPVSSTYTESNLVTEIKQRLSEISATNFTEWKPSYTATRFLLGNKGVYANYSGTLTDGTQVGGRIHAVSVDKVLYCIEIVYPLNFKDDYLSVFAKMRETVKRTAK